MKSMITNLTFEALFAHWDKGRTNFSGGDSGIQDFDLTADFLIIFFHGHNLVTLGLPRSHPGQKNGFTQRFHLSPLSAGYYLHLTKNET